MARAIPRRPTPWSTPRRSPVLARLRRFELDGRIGTTGVTAILEAAPGVRPPRGAGAHGGRRRRQSPQSARARGPTRPTAFATVERGDSTHVATGRPLRRLCRGRSSQPGTKRGLRSRLPVHLETLVVQTACRHRSCRSSACPTPRPSIRPRACCSPRTTRPARHPPRRARGARLRGARGRQRERDPGPSCRASPGTRCRGRTSS